MKNYFLKILVLGIIIIAILILIFGKESILNTNNKHRKQTISAFVRVKNEIKTIEACLESIDGIFDKIVIIHSNEPDDGSVKFMNKWCAKRTYCEIHEYPHAVFPSHSKEYYTGKYKKENTLAAYNNWGLSFFEPEEWIVKIDGDQVYIKKDLAAFLEPFKKGLRNDNYKYGLTGYNSFVKNNQLVLFKDRPINGIDGDSYILKRKNIKKFNQRRYFEIMDIDVRLISLSKPVWFHFMKTLKSNGIIINKEDCPDNKIQYLTPQEKFLFEREIRPLLKNSPYYRVSVPTEEKKE